MLGASQLKFLKIHYISSDFIKIYLECTYTMHYEGEMPISIATIKIFKLWKYSILHWIEKHAH